MTSDEVGGSEGSFTEEVASPASVQLEEVVIIFEEKRHGTKEEC
jgi:hypothetical protein